MEIFKNILIIDDSYAVQSSLKKYLESMNKMFNFSIFKGSNGDEGLNICRTNKIDLIILDLAMPGMNGIQFLIEKNKIERFKDIKVIVLSAVDKEDVVQKAIELGINSFIIKPVELNKLANAVCQMFEVKFQDLLIDEINKPIVIEKSILIIDDSYAISTILKKYLQEFAEYFKFNIYQASDGIEGLSRCRGYKMDLIFLDITMPNMDGIEFLINKNKNEKLKDIPVIVISTINKKEIIKKAIELGAKSYILKPIKLTSLSKSIHEVFDAKFIIFNKEDNGKSEIYINQDIIIAEIHGSFSNEVVHLIGHKLLKITELTEKKERRFIIMFVSIPDDHVTNKKLQTIFTFYEKLDGVKQEDVKIVTNSDKIKNLLLENPETKDINFASTMIEALQILNMQLINEKSAFIQTSLIHPGTILSSASYDEKGQLIKKRNESFTKEDIDNIKKNNIQKLYYLDINCDDGSSIHDISNFEILDEIEFLIK
jgi:CheY-like chemotaxis protein